MNVRLDQTGRIELPALVREELGVSPGDELSFEQNEGRWVLEPVIAGTGPRLLASPLRDWCDDDEEVDYLAVPPRSVRAVKLSKSQVKRAQPARMDFDE